MNAIDRERTLARFWAKVNKTETCWLWTGATRDDGYGRFSDAMLGVRACYAHRFSYEAVVGPIPPGLVIDHLCRVHNCVNPSHLEPVTIGENALRGETFAAKNASKTHCPRGHAYDKQNTAQSCGSRKCRACDAEKKRAKRGSDPANARGPYGANRPICPNGHNPTGLDVGVRAGRGEFCKVCQRIAKKRYDDKIRAALTEVV